MSAGEAARLAHAVRLVLLVQARSRFPHVYLGVALAMTVAVRLLARQHAELVVPALLLGEPGTLGVFLVAGQRFLERNERSATALLVTPLPSGTSIAALVIGTALVGTAAGAVLQGGVLGVDARLALLLPPLFLTVTLSGLLGYVLSGYFSEFTRFILGAVPPLFVYSLPFASHFGLVPPLALVWLPTQWSIAAFANLARPEPDLAAWSAECAALAAANAAGFQWAQHVFRTRIRGRLEVA